MGHVIHLPPRQLPMLRVGPLRVCSHYIRCRHCFEQIEGIGSTPEEAEKHAVDLFAAHVRRCLDLDEAS